MEFIAAGVCLSMALTRQWNVRALAVKALCAAAAEKVPCTATCQALCRTKQQAQDLGASEQETREKSAWPSMMEPSRNYPSAISA